MTELAIRQDEPAHQQPVPVQDPTGGRLVAWAAGLQAAHQLGTALCQTAFSPRHFAGKPEEAAAAILFGDEIGLSPTQALRSVYVISGTPSLYARTMVALVMSHGHEVWTVDKTDAKVTVAGRRKGSSHVIEETWTTTRAQRAGYTSNAKYKSDPESMLYARAAADVCRQIAPDALAGLAYTVEEGELAQPEVTTTARRSEPKTTAQRAPMPEPELKPTEQPAGETEPLLSQGQMRNMQALFRQLGISDRAVRLGYAAKVIGRDIATSNDLTGTEADAVISALETDIRDDQGDGGEPE